MMLENTLESPVARSSQSVLKEINPEYSPEGLLLKLKLQYFGHLMQKTDSLKRPWCWERLRAGGEGNDRGWDGWMASPTQWTWVWVNSRNWWWTGRPGVLQFMGSQRVRHDWATELNWTYTILGYHTELFQCLQISLCSTYSFLSFPFLNPWKLLIFILSPQFCPFLTTCSWNNSL